jgi:prepilin-type N-terminal cleavage/methylation domain-containing protein
MKTHAKRRGFTLIELLVVVTIIAMLAGGAYLGFSALLPKFRSKQAATQAKTIHGWLVAWANERGGNFPEGEQSSNQAYRELFKISVGADEKQFAISGDAYHKGSNNNEGPDGDTGSDPDYTQALEQGENAFAYVSGLSSSDSSRLPLIANGFGPQPGVWAKEKNAKGGVFQGKYGVVCRVGGSSVAHELKDGEFMVKEKSGGQEVNIFNSGFEDMNFNVLNPQ